MLSFLHNPVSSLKGSKNFWAVDAIAIKGRDFGYPESRRLG